MAAGLAVAAIAHPQATNEVASTHPSHRIHPVAVSMAAAPAEMPSPVPAPGQAAPDFVYQSHDFLWQNLHNMLEEHHVLLVFGAAAADLQQLEHQREVLERLGIAPVAVVNRRDGEARRTVRDLNLGFSLLADPRGAIGEQYGVHDSANEQDRAVWFVIDRDGSIRDRGEGLHPDTGWPVLASRALELPPAAITATD